MKGFESAKSRVIPGFVVLVIICAQLVAQSSQTQTDRPKRIRVSEEVMKGILIKSVPPAYPPEAARIRLQGAVVLRTVVGKDGLVKDVKLASGHPLLVDAAMDAVKQWVYQPYFLNGEPVEVESQVTVTFTMGS